jgi:hypothetical protein
VTARGLSPATADGLTLEIGRNRACEILIFLAIVAGIGINPSATLRGPS